MLERRYSYVQNAAPNYTANPFNGYDAMTAEMQLRWT